MEKKKFQKVRYEFYSFSGNGVLSGQSYNLKLENPASIKFTAVGGPNGIVLINKNYALTVWRTQTLMTAALPSELLLENNQDEIDVTNYQIICSADARVNIVCKYYINE